MEGFTLKCRVSRERGFLYNEESVSEVIVYEYMSGCVGASGFCFSIVQLQGLEAHVISQIGQEGKERLPVRFILCHPPLSKALPIF
jgi:hypothetical protein